MRVWSARAHISRRISFGNSENSGKVVNSDIAVDCEMDPKYSMICGSLLIIDGLC
jgi:hypothetical protein